MGQDSYDSAADMILHMAKYGLPKSKTHGDLKKNDSVTPNQVPVASTDRNYKIEKEDPIQIQDLWIDKVLGLVLEFYVYRGTFLASNFSKRPALKPGWLKL